MSEAALAMVLGEDPCGRGRALAAARRAAKMTRQEVAEVAGVTVSMVRRWENGLSDPPVPALITVFNECGYTVTAISSRTGSYQ